jgi:hypothetical protein
MGTTFRPRQLGSRAAGAPVDSEAEAKLSAADRRRAARIALAVPAAVVSRTGPLVAEVRDVSTSGVRLFLRAELLGLSRPLDLLQAALAVRAACPDAFPIRLQLGRRVELERAVTIARLVLPSFEPDCIELGCMFEQPLAPDELEHVCGAAPHVASSDRRGVRRREPEPAAAARPAIEARQRGEGPCRVVVASRGAERGLVCEATELTLDGVHVRASDTALGARDAPEAALLFVRRYGTDVSLEILDDARRLWSGPARVLGMEIVFERPDDLLLTIAFGRPLRPDEIERLGLPARAA